MRPHWVKLKKRNDNKHAVKVEVEGDRILENKRGFVRLRPVNKGESLFAEIINRSVLDELYDTDAYI